MHIVIAGGSGFLGNALTNELITQGNRVSWLSSNCNKQIIAPRQVNIVSYNYITELTDVDVVINLAGAGIADKPWTNKRKHILEESRIKTTQILVDWMRSLEKRPHTFVSGSAIGWYGAQGDKPLTEQSEPIIEYQHQLCDQWEKIALQAQDITRVLIVRTGVVLDESGGMLAKIKMPFSLGLGGNLGNGEQVLSWVSLTDWVRAVVFLLNGSEQQGIYNITAPNAVTNADFTKSVARSLNRPAFMHIPAFILKTLLGDMSTLLLDGQRVLPQKLLDAGFMFEHQSIGELFNLKQSD